MFDTPDLMPFCVALFIALFVGVLVYSIGIFTGYIIRRKSGKKPRWWKEMIWALVILFVPLACFTSIALEIGTGTPSPWFKPTIKNVAGTWKLTQDQVNHIQQWQKTPVLEHELVFRGDGTFYLQNIPSFWGRVDAESGWHAKYMSGSGTWYLKQIEGTQRLEWVIFAQFQKINDLDDDRLMRFYFEGHLPPYTLVTLDSENMAMRFAK